MKHLYSTFAIIFSIIAFFSALYALESPEVTNGWLTVVGLGIIVAWFAISSALLIKSD